MVESNVSHSERTAHRQLPDPERDLRGDPRAIQGHRAAVAHLTCLLLCHFFCGLAAASWRGRSAGAYNKQLCTRSCSNKHTPTFAKDFPMVLRRRCSRVFTFRVSLILTLTYGVEMFTSNLMYLLLARMHPRQPSAKC